MKDKDKNNITNFQKIKEELDKNNKSNDLNSGFDFKSIISDYNLNINDEELKDILSMLNMDDMIEKINSGRLNYNDIQNSLSKLKKFEDDINKSKKIYRSFNQWNKFNKPYNISTFYPIESIRKIADELDIKYSSLDSKNQIISYITGELDRYLYKTIKLFDTELYNILGRVIYNSGKLEVDYEMTEEEEQLIDFLQGQCIVTRLNENGKHYIIMPSEIYTYIMNLNFSELSSFISKNTIVKETTIAFANSYGVYPKQILFDRLDKIYDENREKNIECINNIIEYYFLKSTLKFLMHGFISIDSDYIKHGIVEFTKYLIDLQNEKIEKYKFLTDEDIKIRGKILYNDNSLYIKEAVDIINLENDLSKEDVLYIKNLICIFSHLEFEPNLILQLLSSKYTIEINSSYAKILSILRNYYKNSEKWILKGHTPFEANASDLSFDANKIIKLDF